MDKNIVKKLFRLIDVIFVALHIYIFLINEATRSVIFNNMTVFIYVMILTGLAYYVIYRLKKKFLLDDDK